MNIPKFRAWLKLSEKMINVDVINTKSRYVFCIGDEVDGINEWDSHSFDGIELMQSTGLHDVAGNEIFLDDVLKYDNDELFQVVHLDQTARYAMQGLRTGKIRWFRGECANALAYNSYSEFEFAPSSLTIVHNIHQNNELLND